MTAFFLAFERACLVGLVALLVATIAQFLLDNRVPAAWRVWIWRAALLQMALALLPLTPISLAVLSARVSTSGTSSGTSSGNSGIVNDATRAIDKPTGTFGGATKRLLHITRASSGATKTPQDELGTLDQSTKTPSDETRGDETESVRSAITAPHDAHHTSPKPSFHPVLRFDVRFAALALYVVGWVWQIVVLWRSARRMKRMLRTCQPLANAVVEEQARLLAKRFSTRTPRLRCIESGAPFLTGAFRPTIVLPGALLESPAHLEPVLAHELAHLKRLDLRWNALLWLVQTAFWFHPLTWIARQLLALETESACDETVLLMTRIPPRSYGALLLNTMKLESTPLAAGITDGFDTLKVRLKRLNRTPKRPHRAVQIALIGILALTLASAVPLRFVARAGVLPSSAAVSRQLTGVVRDEAGQPVAGATIYALRTYHNGEVPLETTLSDDKGEFRFSPKVRMTRGIELLADAGTRGMGRLVPGSLDTLYTRHDDAPLVLTVQPSTHLSIRFVDSRNRPVAGLKVRLWRVGPSPNAWMALPKAMLRSMQGTTNARGVVSFPPLRSGMIAQFILSDQIAKPTIYGLGDLRGRRFAPLLTEEFVVLKAPRTSKTIRLQNVANLKGRISFPDARGAGNVLIMARRINAAEQGGARGGEIDQLIAQTRSNGSGQYVLHGLRPGKYWLWIYPEKRLTRDWAGSTLQKTFAPGANTQSFTLSRGAIIEGTVLSQQTKKPVKGQTLGLFDSQNSYQYAITDARGYFRFRALGGKQHLWVHANGINSPPPGFGLPLKSEFNFSVENGEKRRFAIELPGKLVVKPVTGQVLDPDGKPASGATVLYGIVTSRGSQLQSAQSNGEGRFSIPLKWSAHPLQLFAESGELATPHSTIVVGGSDVKLRLAVDVWASIEGRVMDENEAPIAGAALRLFSSGGLHDQKTMSDENGNFRLARLQPGTSVGVEVIKNGFPLGFEIVSSAQLKVGATHRLEFSLRLASKTLAGVVLNEDGTPARGFQIWADGQNRSLLTQNDGRFFLPQVLAGPIWVRVSSPQGSSGWQPFPARGGDRNVAIRLNRTKRDVSLSLPKNRVLPASLIGKSAPAIRAAKWGNRAAPLSGLRGKVVVLAFDAFNFNQNQISDFAQSFAGQVEVVGIQFNLPARFRSKKAVDVDEIARQMAFPIALDAPLPESQGIGGQTFAAYGNAPFAVIGRDGKVLYASGDLERAITLAATA